MTDKAISTAAAKASAPSRARTCTTHASTPSAGVFGQLVRSVTEKPLGEINDRLRDHSKRTKNGLERLLRAIERTPAEAPKRRQKRHS